MTQAVCGAAPRLRARSAKRTIRARHTLRDTLIPVDVPLFRRHMEERFLDILQNSVVHGASGRDGAETLQELDGAAEKPLEAVFLVADQEVQVAAVVCGR